ncbi:hypothetical protein ACFU6S_44040 [Streptomyces sp. NPDC057456]|uniref:hypothetical protein n=1 Tax=Streptomyces sp. NPDC057456 TaxID=3346139 RepID=UPI0036ADD19E
MFAIQHLSGLLQGGLDFVECCVLAMLTANETRQRNLSRGRVPRLSSASQTKKFSLQGLDAASGMIRYLLSLLAFRFRARELPAEVFLLALCTVQAAVCCLDLWWNRTACCTKCVKTSRQLSNLGLSLPEERKEHSGDL